MGNKLELLAPAGDMERLNMAVAYGADAVYLAGTTFGMRAYAGNFSRDELYQAVRLCKAHGVRVHVTINTMPRGDEIAQLPAWLEVLDDAGVTAVIVADLGAFRLAQKYAPHVQKHISTQASVSNAITATAWYELGASRVILARECSLAEIREIRAKTPKELELEAFGHGAMCVSYSGRCLLSNYMTGRGGRDSSRGACAQPCRYQYALMEEKRPGEYFPVYEDEKGSYILSSRDMCMIDHVPELLDAGLDSLKIEGRAKSAYYAALVTGAYRHAIDAAQARQPLPQVWRDEVEKVSHRPYSTGFYFGDPGQYYEDARYIREWQITGIVQSCDSDGNAVVSLRNKFRAGDALELVGPDLAPVAFEAPMMEDLDGFPLEEPKKPQMLFRMRLPVQAPPLSILRRQAEGL
ncbi:MAG: U32 family peptidase [Clostridiales bacterium]|nr:U32 family peptidase [Clostridiales bacterium]